MHHFFKYPKPQTVRQYNLTRILLLITLVTLIWSCKKEPDLLGLDMIPESDLLNHEFIDTTTIIAYTVMEDSLRTDVMTTNLLGSVSDPEFGTTTASIYTQFRLSSTNVSFGTNPVVDSMILTIPYKGNYGDTLAMQNIRVYELDDTLSQYKLYYHISTVPVSSQIVGQASFVPNTWLADSVDGVKIYPHMRIALTQEFANKLLTSDSATLATNTNFTKVFKGLYLTSEDATTPGSGAIMYLDLNHSQSKITLYYHNSSDTLTEEFLINSNSVKFNHYNHFNYTGANPLLLDQFAGNPTSGREKLFLQSMGGAKIKLEFPYLESLSKKKIAVHEAALILENENPDDFYPMPSLIGIRTFDTAYHVLPDESEGSSYINGIAVTNSKYRIRITRYVQNRLLHPEEADDPLYIIAAGSSLSSNRAVIKGTAAGAGRMRLLIYYTEVE